MKYARAALVCVALVAAVVPLPAQWIEQWYSRGLYPRLQPPVTAVSSLAPIALFDVLAAVVLAAGTFALIRGWRARGPAHAIRRLAVSAVVLAAALYLWFLLFWGLNYRRVPLEQKLVFEVSRITRGEAVKLARMAIEQVNALAALPGEASGHGDEGLAYALAEAESALGSGSHAMIARPKSSLLGVYFRQAAIDGMTDPFFLEVIVNPDLLPSERPMVLAHEWAHLAGYADESEANFIAWLACIRADPAARYSGWLAAYQHIAGGLPADDRRALAALLAPAVVADLTAERRRYDRSNRTVRSAARGAYDTYLRANRIEEGIANYNAVVRLMLGASFDANWNPRLR